jgi:hypothetical protein
MSPMRSTGENWRTQASKAAPLRPSQGTGFRAESRTEPSPATTAATFTHAIHTM